MLKGHLSILDQVKVKQSEAEKLTKIKDEIIFLQVLGEIEGMEWGRMKGVLRTGVGWGEGAEEGGERRGGKLEILQS